MFTGIIQHSGVVETLDRLPSGARLRISTTDDQPFTRGESLSVNGVCLTVLPEGDLLTADVSLETLSRTTLGQLEEGTRVNVERALTLSGRLGGHLVQGHVDAVGKLLSVAEQGEFAIYRWSFPGQFAELVVGKGSIAVDGVSLTVIDPDEGSFAAALIPETLRRTNLGSAHVGAQVNLEFDMLAKYVRSLLLPYLRRTLE